LREGAEERNDFRRTTEAPDAAYDFTRAAARPLTPHTLTLTNSPLTYSPLTNLTHSPTHP